MSARIIDNQRVSLVEVLNDLAAKHKNLSIATGYWDLPGMQLVFDQIRNFDSVRLLIGEEPSAPQRAGNLNIHDLDSTFPESQLKSDLETIAFSTELRQVVSGIKKMIDDGRLEVKIYRGGFMHAKTFIFGDFNDDAAVGIIGSSNFTRPGLTSNIELNALEDDTRIVKSTPHAESDEHGHLSWFNAIWSSDSAEVWDGKFIDILQNSPVGDLLYSPYHMYIKSLYEIYSDELVPDATVSQEIEDVLYDFQLRNAKLLIKKLHRNSLAMLADSVGLGKTITAGAVIRHYIEELGARRVYVVAPASLSAQWREDLAKVHGVFSGYEVISMQDVNRISREREIDKYAPVNLFVVDEAHNLRSGVGSRHDELLSWFSDNDESHVLLLTATPINNSLSDFVNQIQLAAKGNLSSFPVVYPASNKTEVIDFFEAVKRLSKDIKTAEQQGRQPDFDKVHRVMRQGLRHFLVRTTRAGIEREFGGIKKSDGTLQKFPASHVIPTPYQFSPDLLQHLDAIIDEHLSVFDGVDVKSLDVTQLLQMTQRSQHPLDILKQNSFEPVEINNAFTRIFQALLLLGFAPYKPEIYKKQFYSKSMEEIKALRLDPNQSFKVTSQLSIHNMLRITLLKRFESSQHALKKSLENYEQKLRSFLEVLDQGYIVPVGDLAGIMSQFGDDLDRMDYEDDKIEYVQANEQIFNLEALRLDLKRDLQILEVLKLLCDELAKSDDKLRNLAGLIRELRSSQPAGKKILLFSYYTDTIEYIQQQLPKYYPDEDLDSVAAYTNGKSKAAIEKLAKRFSPQSKGGEKLVRDEGEIDLLFASDVLSEGQNLQDCGMLINFDLHWNPVRMIQRNGRINRLGSQYETVQIFNYHPDVNLDEYLTLVNRLQKKIDRIRFTVGTDQSVLGEMVNPIEFAEDLESSIVQEELICALYKTDAADRAFGEFDDDEGLLSEDEFIYDLRQFESEANEIEKALVHGIPLGKWGKLSKRASVNLDSAESLALIRVSGKVSDSEQNFVNHVFVSTNSAVGAIETMSALGALRLQSDDTHRGLDTISINRNEVIKRARVVARQQMKYVPTFFRVTPSRTRILDVFSRQLPHVDLHSALLRITTKQEQKRAESLFRMATLNLKNSDTILESTLESLTVLALQLNSKPSLEKAIPDDGVVGVIYFGI